MVTGSKRSPFARGRAPAGGAGEVGVGAGAGAGAGVSAMRTFGSNRTRDSERGEQARERAGASVSERGSEREGARERALGWHKLSAPAAARAGSGSRSGRRLRSTTVSGLRCAPGSARGTAAWRRARRREGGCRGRGRPCSCGRTVRSFFVFGITENRKFHSRKIDTKKIRHKPPVKLLRSWSSTRTTTHKKDKTQNVG